MLKLCRYTQQTYLVNVVFTQVIFLMVLPNIICSCYYKIYIYGRAKTTTYISPSCTTN